MKRISPIRPDMLKSPVLLLKRHGLRKKSFPMVLFLLLGISGLSMISCGPPPPPRRSQAVQTLTAESSPSVYTADSSVMDAAYFLKEMSNLKRLTVHHPDERILSFSSRHPDNDHRDYGNFIEAYEEDGKTWKVMLDVDGPGVLTRMFFNNDITGTLKIYFDYQAEPSIVSTFQDLYQLNHELFDLYVAYSPERSGNGFSSYFPMPFEKHCTILTDSPTEEIKYQFDIRTFPVETPLRTFTGKLDRRTQAALDQYNEFVVRNAIGKYTDTIIKGFNDLEIKPGTAKLAANDNGPAAINFFAVDVSPADRETLSSVTIKMFWDDQKEASVDLAVMDFFAANSMAIDSWNSTFVGYYPKSESFPRGFFYSQFYLPFQKKAQILFENNSDQNIQVHFLRHIEYADLPQDPLYFFARNDVKKFPMGLIYPVFEFEGKGNFVGINQAVSPQAELEPVNFALEGDPSIYVDGEEQPSIQAPGMDNYFNTHTLLQYYTPFSLPTHGCLFSTREQPGFAHTYRFQLLDAVPFNTSLFFIQEIGDPAMFTNMEHENQVFAQYQWTCYWYGKIATEPVERKEHVYHYAFNRAPNYNDPVMKNFRLFLQLPPGEWTMSYAPVWDLSKIQQQVYQVE